MAKASASKKAPVISMALVADTGSSATDRITSNPAVKGTGQANTLVTIKNGAVVLGTTTADNTGAWSFTPSGLTDGARTQSYELAALGTAEVKAEIDGWLAARAAAAPV